MASTETVKEQSAGRRGWSQRLASLAPALIGLIVAFAVGIGAYLLSGTVSRDGVRASTVTIDDPYNFFDEFALEEEIREVTWGGHIDVLVVVSTFKDQGYGDRCTDSLFCLADSYPDFFASAHRVDDSTVVLWVEPERRIVDVRMGIFSRYKPDYFYETEFELAKQLEFLAAEDRLTEEVVGASLQVLSDSATGTTATTTLARIVIGLVAGIVTFALVTVGIMALNQNRQARHRAGSYARLSRKERLSAIRSARDAFTLASESLEEIELVALREAGPYSATLRARVAQWQHRYTDLARAWFQTHGLTDSQLAHASRRDVVASLDRHATIVGEAQQVLLADDRLLANQSGWDDHPSRNHLSKAIEQGEKLAQATSDKTLAEKLASYRRTLNEQSAPTSLNETVRILVAWDEIAVGLGSLTEPALATHAIAEGAPFPGRVVVEDAGRFRALGSLNPAEVPAELRTSWTEELLTEEELSDLEVAARRRERAGRSIRVPLSPLIVLLATVVAMGAGLIYALQQQPGEDRVMDGNEVIAQFPDSLASSSEKRNGAMNVYGGADQHDLRTSSSITILDHADLMSDVDVLTEALGTIPLPSDVPIVVLTSPTVVRADEESEPDWSPLADEFPDYLWASDDHTFAAPIENDAVTVLIAQSGEESRVWYAFGDPQWQADEQASSYWYPAGHLRDINVDIEVAVWNAVVAASNVGRDIVPNQTEATATVGSNVVESAILVALVVFVITIIIAMPLLAPIRSSRQRRAWRDGTKGIMTAVTLAQDALRLEVLAVAHDHPTYPIEERYSAWEGEYRRALALLKKGGENGTAGDDVLRQRFDTARLLRSQTESLWRSRTILGQESMWVFAWDDEVAATFVAGSPDTDDLGERLAAVTKAVVTGTVTPDDALAKLDSIARLSAGSTRLRCLDESEDVSVTKIAQTGALSLVDNDEVGLGVAGESQIGVGESVTEIRHHGTVATFFSIDTSLIDLVRRSLRRGAHRAWRWLWRPAPVVAGIVLAIIAFPFVFYGIPELMKESKTEHVVTYDGPPLSVTIIDDNDLVDDERIVNALKNASMGYRAHVIVYTNEDTCEFGEISGIDITDPRLVPAIVQSGSDNFTVREGSVLLCLSPDGFVLDSPPIIWESDDFDLPWRIDEDQDLTDQLIDTIDAAEGKKLFDQSYYLIDNVTRQLKAN